MATEREKALLDAARMAEIADREFDGRPSSAGRIGHVYVTVRVTAKDVERCIEESTGDDGKIDAKKLAEKLSEFAEDKAEWAAENAARDAAERAVEDATYPESGLRDFARELRHAASVEESRAAYIAANQARAANH